MIPIGKRYNDFFVIEIFVWVFGIMYDKRTSKTIWILTALMGVIPIRARLADLFLSEFATNFTQTLRNSR
jgi:hypothetical protein